MFLIRLRVGPFEGPANGKPPALPEVHDYTNSESLIHDTNPAPHSYIRRFGPRLWRKFTTVICEFMPGAFRGTGQTIRRYDRRPIVDDFWSCLMPDRG